MAFIILKLKKFGTTRTLSKAGHPVKLGEKRLGKKGDQEVDGHSG